MRSVTQILAGLLLLLWPISGQGGELTLLQGEIQSVDGPGRSMIVKTGMAHQQGGLVRIVLSENMVAENGAIPAAWHNCLTAGRSIEVWGTESGNGQGVFLAESFRGCSMSGCGDPTGVRARLYRNRQNKQREFFCRE